LDTGLQREPVPNDTAAGETNGSANIPRLFLGLAITLALLAYSGALRFRFVYDDTVQILQNSHLQSWRYLHWYFTRDVWSHAASHAGNYYRPLFLVWMRLNYQVFGANPVGWHATTLLVHLAVIVLVYLLVAHELEDRIAAGFAALLFALHPIHIEGVAWISGVTEPLMAGLWIGSFLGYLRWREGKGKAWAAVSLALFALALLVKETAIVLPVLVFLREWKALSADRRGILSGPGPVAPDGKGNLCRAAVVCVPFVVIAALYLIVRTLVLGGVAPSPGNNAGAMTVVLTWPAIVVAYLQKLIWPWRLSLFYVVPFVTKCGFRNFVLPLMILLATGTGGWWASKRQPKVFLAGAWLLVPLLPAIAATFRMERGELVHDRYLYVPSVGFVMLCALGLRCLQAGRRKLFTLPAAQAVGICVMVCALGVATAVQNVYWASDLILYSHAVSRSPQSTPARTLLANELFKRGQTQAALRLYEQALADDPDDWKAHWMLSLALMDLHDWPQAEQHLLRTTQLRTDNPTPFLVLGLAQGTEGKLAQAEASLRHAIALPPLPPRVHFGLATLLQQEDRLAEAREEYQAELAVDPHSDAQQKIQELDRKLASGK
jgi:Tfp pilus assembly protein PilF